MKKKLLIISAALLVVGGLMIAFLDTKGAAPAFECTSEHGPTSGFSDSSQNDCPISIESFNKWREWNKSPHYGRIAGLGLVVIALVTGVTGLVLRKKQ